MSLAKMIPARYIHFGMTHEMYDLLVNDIERYKYLGWERRVCTNSVKATVINSFVSGDTVLSDNCYIEDSIIYNCKVGDAAILSNIDAENLNIPANTVLHAVKLNNGRYVCRIYGKDDNPKSAYTSRFLTGTIERLIDYTKVTMDEIWDKATPSIWNARIYPECDSLQNAVISALDLYQIITGTADEEKIIKWKNCKKYSLASSFNQANVLAIIERQEKIAQKVMIDKFVQSVKNGQAVEENLHLLEIKENCVEEILSCIKSIADTEQFPHNMRLYLACADICKKYNLATEEYSYSLLEDLTYKSICETIIDATFKKFKVNFSALCLVKESATVELPVRVNFCGSPSDAAPYCLEHGGTMIDAALLLKGKRPVKVTARKIQEKEVRLGSLDQGCLDVFDNLQELRNCSNPFDPTSLRKEPGQLLPITGRIFGQHQKL